MKNLRHVTIAGPLLMVFLILLGHACAAELTPEEKQLVATLKQDLDRIREEIDQAKTEDTAYTGGLIKSLIGVRLQVLKTNEALVEQRIHAVEGGAGVKTVVNTVKNDPERAAALAKEIESQRAKVAEARAEADRYSGGLVHAMAETSVATSRNTLALLEQQYIVAKYGAAIPVVPSGISPSAEADVRKTAIPTSSASTREAPSECLKIDALDSSVLSANEVFTELAWKVDVSNSCEEPFAVRVTFTLYDDEEFELDSDIEEVYVPGKGTGTARGKMLISPPEKARRMAKQGASLSAR